MANGVNNQELTNQEIVDIYQDIGFPAPTPKEIRNNIRGELPVNSQRELENVLLEQKRRMEDDGMPRMEGKRERRWISPTEFKQLQQNYEPQEIRDMTETVTDDNGNTTYYWRKDIYENMSSNQKPGGTTLTPGQVKEQFQAYGYAPNEEDIRYWTNKDQNELETLQQNLADRRNQEIQEEQQAAQSGEMPIGKPFFRGNEALVRFVDGGRGINENTIWSVDPEAQTMRPILSPDAFEARFGKTPRQAMQEGRVKDISTNYLNTGAPLAGFEMLSDEQGIGESGTYERTEEEEARAANNNQQPNQGEEREFDPVKIMNTYGERTNEALNREVFKAIDNGMLSWLKKMGKKNNGGISEETINQISNNPETVATYVNALAYGGYNVSDIYRDIKRRDLIRQGNEEYKDVKIIDETTKASDFYSKEENQGIRTNPDLNPPDSLGEIDSTLLDNPIYDVPNDVYKTLVQPFDWTSEEGREALDEIKSAYHDVLLQQLEAKTEQQKARADEAYQEMVEQVERNYGIKLSDDTTQAWNKINNLDKQIRNRGLRGTGIGREMKQKYLQDVRAGQERMRQNKADELEAEKEKYLRKFATPEEIQELSEEEKRELGFKPSQQAKEFFSKENLKEKYPDLTDRQIEEYRNSILDEYGNYRSEAYQTLWDKKKKIREDKRTYQLGDVKVDEETGEIVGGHGLLYQKALESEKAYEPYEEGGAFEKPTIKDEQETQGTQGTQGTQKDITEKEGEGVGQISESKMLETTDKEKAQSSPGYKYVEEEENILGDTPSKQARENLDVDLSKYEKIPTREDMTDYTDIQDPGTGTLYGKRVQQEEEKDENETAKKQNIIKNEINKSKDKKNKWQEFREKKNLGKGFEKITTPYESKEELMKDYTDVQDPGTGALYGKRK